MLFNNGKKVGMFVGAKNEKDVDGFIQSTIKGKK
jgi:thioredoxin-like negative regulator of GroEL